MYEIKKVLPQVCAVLDKYHINYEHYGVNANLYAWANNKQPLIDRLRNHPNWSEDELAVIMSVDENRDIEPETVREHMHSMHSLSMELGQATSVRDNFYDILDYACCGFSKTMEDEGFIAKINKDGVKCALGQKTSRVVNAICRKYGIDKHSDYNSVFAKLADSLNPMIIKRTAVLSVNPCDYLEMSNGGKDINKRGWSSCHRLNGGEYQAGTLSYMNDDASMIFYTADDDITADYHKHIKRTRQVFCYENGILLQSRLYPNTHDNTAKINYRNIVQHIITGSLGIPNLWVFTQEHICNHFNTHISSLHFADYEQSVFKCGISKLKAIDSAGYRITIGNEAYCLKCGDGLNQNGYLFCENCNGTHICCDCGDEFDEDDGHFINGNYYCDNCVSHCDRCYEYFHGEAHTVINRHGYEICVCDHCIENYYYCDECGCYYEYPLTEIDGLDYCDECLNEYFTECSNCGGYIRNEDTICHGDDCYCAECYKELKEKQAAETEIPAAV